MTEQVLPDSAYRITSHEILALLAFAPGPGTGLTRRVLGLEELPDDHDLVRAGVGTLNVRDSASVDGEQVTLQGPAKYLAGVFSTSTTWFDVTRVGPGAVSPAYVAEAPVGRVALFLRPLSEYVCLPLGEETSGLDMVEATVEDALALAESSPGAIITSRRYEAGTEPKVANIKITANNRIQLASGPVDAAGQLTVRELGTDEKAGSVVRDLLTVPA